MDLLPLLDGLSKKNIAPVYLLHGEERFLIDLFVAKLKRLVIAGPMADLNFHRVRADDLGGAEIAAMTREVPMMAERKLLVVENAHKLNATELAKIDPHLKEPQPQTCLVLIADKFDLRRGTCASANRRKQVHKAEPIKERSIVPFLRQRAKARKVTMAQEAISALAQAVGPSCAALDDAVERLGLFVGPEREVTGRDVADLIAQVRERSIFELVDAIGNRQAKQAMMIVEDLLSNQKEPLMINAMLARHLRQLLNARIHLHLGTRRAELPKLLSAPVFLIDKLMAQTRRFRGSELESALERIARTDFELKSSRRPPHVVIEQTVLDLCLS